VVNKANKQIICTAIGKGRRHDFHLFKQSNIHFKPTTTVLDDTGYLGIKKLHSNNLQPKKNTKKKPLTKEEKLENKKINAERVIVEHVIRGVKIFKILTEKYRNRRKRFGLRLNLIAAMYNQLL
jgi:hypothetical protein